MSKKSFLDRIEIPRPCFADWERMVGTEQIRFCNECNKHVYNLSGMTRGEAEALVASAPKGRLCARITREADGVTVTTDDQPGVQLIWRRASPIANAVVSALLTMATPGAGSAAQKTGQLSTIASVIDRPDARADSQGATASLSGTVVDQMGAVIQGATLTLINEDTGDTQTTASSDDGTFRFFVLTDGVFTLKAESSGFRRGEAPGLKLGAGHDKHLDISIKVTLTVATMGGAIVITENPLRQLYADSDLVMVARTAQSLKLKSEGERHWTRTSLIVSSTLKGSGSEPLVNVYHYVYNDDQNPFPREESFLVFLRHAGTIADPKSPNGYELVGYSRGIKKLSSSELDAYVQRINELAQLHQEQEPNQEDLVEWLVRCAEDPATRWEGAYELASSAYDLRARRMEDDSAIDSEDSDSSEEPVEENDGETTEAETTVETAIEAYELGVDATFAALLTADQKERLVKALLTTEEMTGGDEPLIELVKDFNDSRMLPFLVSQLRRMEDNPPEIASTIVPVVAELLNNKRITGLAQTYQDAPYDDEDEDDTNANQDTVRTRSAAVRERSAQIRLFLQQVDRVTRSGSEAQNLKSANR